MYVSRPLPLESKDFRAYIVTRSPLRRKAYFSRKWLAVFSRQTRWNGLARSCRSPHMPSFLTKLSLLSMSNFLSELLRRGFGVEE